MLTLADLTILNGSSQVISDNGATVLRLTEARLFNSGSAFSDKQVDLRLNFSASYSFRINDNVGEGADGFVFAILANTNETLGARGEGIGYIGIRNSVGFEFDTFLNENLPNDPNGNHIALNINGEYGPAGKNKAIPIFDSGQLVYAWIDYYFQSKRIDIYVSTSSDKNSAVLGYRGNLDIAAAIGSEVGYIGFTSATGASANTHDIASLQFNSFAPNEKEGDILTGYWQRKKIKLKSNKLASAYILGDSTGRDVREISVGSIYADDDRNADGIGAAVAVKKNKRLSFSYGDFNNDQVLDIKLDFKGRDLGGNISKPLYELSIFGNFNDGQQFIMSTIASSLPRIN